MRALVPSETALVLGGGGAKGAYEVGAIAALDELGIKAGLSQQPQADWNLCGHVCAGKHGRGSSALG